MKPKLNRREFYRRKFRRDFRLLFWIINGLFALIVAAGVFAQEYMRERYQHIDNLSPMMVTVLVVGALVVVVVWLVSDKAGGDYMSRKEMHRMNKNDR